MTIVVSDHQTFAEEASHAEIFGVGIFYFETDGAQKLRKFESAALPYFNQHQLTVSHFLNTQGIIAAIGEDDIPIPDEIQFLTIKNAEQLNGLFSNQGFLDLVPQRNEATRHLSFFLGKKLY